MNNFPTIDRSSIENLIYKSAKYINQKFMKYIWPLLKVVLRICSLLLVIVIATMFAFVIVRGIMLIFMNNNLFKFYTLLMDFDYKILWDEISSFNFFCVQEHILASWDSYKVDKDKLNEAKKAVYIGTTVFSGGLIITHLGKLTEYTKTFSEIIQGKMHSLTSIFFSTLAFFIIIFFGVISLFESEKSRNATIAENSNNMNLLFNGNSLNDSTLATLYITFEEEKDSIKIGNSQLVLLKNLSNSLIACMQQNDKPVELFLVGYASSSGTDSLNLRLANGRARWVGHYLDSLKNSNDTIKTRFTIKTHRWDHIREMRSSINFNDLIRKKHYSEEMAALTRRVEIKIIRAAGCEI